MKKTNKTGEIARLEFPWDTETDRKLIVTVIDSIGFGDTMDENKSFLPIQNFIVQKFSEWRKIKASGEYDEKEALRDPVFTAACIFYSHHEFENATKSTCQSWKIMSQLCPL